MFLLTIVVDWMVAPKGYVSVLISRMCDYYHISQKVNMTLDSNRGDYITDNEIRFSEIIWVDSKCHQK